MTRRPILAGNWKMHMLTGEAIQLAGALAKEVGELTDRDVVLIPPFTALAAVHGAIAGTRIGLGAQNGHWEPKGAFTGEISMPMIKDAGCQYVTIGHSERRQYFGETNQSCRAKIQAALVAGLTPIYCLGETLEQREANRTFQVVETQLAEGLAGFNADELATLVIAYEPVWAIGTGKTATPEQAQEVHAFIRGRLAEAFGPARAEATRIQYGGSVKPDNVDELMAKPDIDGALVGGAALKADGFARIVKFLS
ncbi:MAG: triose-phosphate isomerase [Myxococcales bacterium]|nr:triose-phosphate isomerase [Myxococcales bacterium]